LQQIQNLKEKPVKQFPKNKTRYRIIEDRKKKCKIKTNRISTY
jgi:hypothetical protein